MNDLLFCTRPKWRLLRKEHISSKGITLLIELTWRSRYFCWLQHPLQEGSQYLFEYSHLVPTSNATPASKCGVFMIADLPLTVALSCYETSKKCWLAFWLPSFISAHPCLNVHSIATKKHISKASLPPVVYRSCSQYWAISSISLPYQLSMPQ